VAEYIERGGDPEVGGPAITAAAAAGEPRALAALTTVGEWLGRGLASLIAVLDPQRVVVGGGLGEAGELLLGPAREVMTQTVTGAGRRPLPELVPAALGNRAGFIGAAFEAARL
jgi:glucokinase